MISPSRWPVVLYVLWALLTARIVVAIARHESPASDALALPGIALFVTSALIGSRLWSFIQKRART